MRKLFVLVLLILLLIGAGAVFASGGQEKTGTAGEEPIELTFVYRTGVGNLVRVTRAAIEKFEKENPNITIDFQQPAGDTWTNLRVMLAAGDKVDLAAMDDEIYPSFANTGLLTDLKPWMERDFDLDDFIPSSLAVYDWFGKYYAVPFTGASVALYYNKTLFDDAGVTGPPQKPGYMWDQFLADAGKLTQDTNGDGKTDIFGFALNTWWPYPQAWLWRNGGSVYTNDMSAVNIDSPESKEALEFYAGLRVQYRYAPSAQETADISPNDMMQTQRLAMVEQGPWVLAQYSDADVDYRLALPPGSRNGHWTRVTWDAYCIPATSENPEAAWLYLKQFADLDYVKTIAKQIGQLPPQRSVAYSDAFATNPDTPYNEQVFLDAGERWGKISEITLRYPEMNQAMGNILAKIFIGEGTVDEVVDNELVPELEKLLAPEDQDRFTTYLQNIGF